MKNLKNLKKIFEEKKLFHKKMAEIPFEQKIKTLVKLQKLANEIKSVTGREKERVWKI